jgi:hypothetical protein
MLAGGERVQEGRLERPWKPSGWSLGAIVSVLGFASAASAQTDYYNTDRNRPVRIEDAYATERYAIELKLAPSRVERDGHGVYTWSIEPGVAFGVLPRTDIEVAVPLSQVDLGNERAGVGGIELSAFHNLNVETRTLPAFGIRGEVTLPVGSHAPDRARPAVTAIATRSLLGGRIHLNGRYTFGSAVTDEAADTPAGEHNTRWLAGAAIDRALPLRSLLLIADVYAGRPLDGTEPVTWNAGGGIRYQVSPRLIMDAGIGRRMTGRTGWYGTFGSALHFSLRSLIPGAP